MRKEIHQGRAASLPKPASALKGKVGGEVSFDMATRGSTLEAWTISIQKMLDP